MSKNPFSTGGAGGEDAGNKGQPQPGGGQDNSGLQGVNYAAVSARVPEKVSRGAFVTNFVVLHGTQEFAVDFLLRMVPPQMLAARVIMPYSALGLLVGAVQESVDGYRSRFGSPPSPPPPPPNFVPPKIADLYEEMKLPDDAIVGAYANKLMITHTIGEFCFDFIADLFPRPVVTARIYMAAAQAPLLLDTLKRTLTHVQANLAQQQQHALQQAAQQLAQQIAHQSPQQASHPDSQAPGPSAPSEATPSPPAAPPDAAPPPPSA